MPRRAADREDGDWDDDEDWDVDDDPDADDDDDEPTVACPYCRKQIHEDSQRCPHCEQYISEEDRPSWRPRWWVILGAVLGLLAVYTWFAH
jgi:predicted nucleic acid-binding Zn ribbon protein